MLVEEGLHRRLHHLRIENAAAVARPGDLVERDIGLRLFQRLVEQLALVKRHREVLLAVHDEEGRRVFRHIGDGIGPRDLLVVFLDRTPHQLRFGRRRRIVFQGRTRQGMGIHLQEIGRAEKIHDGLHAAGLVRIAQVAFEIGHAARDSEQRGQVSARGFSPGPDVAGVQPELRGVGPEPADRRLAVVDLRRKQRLRTQAVVDHRHRVTTGRQPGGSGGLVRAVARPPGTAVHPDDHGNIPGAGFRAVEIQHQILLAGPGKHQIALDRGARRRRDRGLRQAGRHGPKKCRGQDARWQSPFSTSHV